MSAGVAFSFEDAERRFGPAIVAESKRAAAAAPRLRPEQVAYLQALFASVHFIEPQAPAAEAA